MRPPVSPNDKKRSEDGMDPIRPTVSDEAQQKMSTISGPIGRGSGPVSDVIRQGAKAMLNLLSRADAIPRHNGPEDTPPTEESSNILIGVGSEKPVKLDNLLTAALGKVGYKRIGELIYRADWSTPDVEHILSFETYGTPKEFLIGDLGFRNNEAEAFAEECQRRYSDPIIRNSDLTLPPWWCPMHCSLGMLAGWKSSNLYIPRYSQAELGSQVVEAVRDFVRPYVGGVTTIDSLFEFLAQDTEPMRWFRVGGYFRAAEVAFLGCKLGVAPDQVEAILKRYRREMENGLDKRELTPDEYIAHIIRDARAVVGGGSQ